MEPFFPEQLIAYLLVFRQAFSRPNFVYFQSFVWGLLLVEGRKCTSRITRACFYVDRTLGSFERFLSEYHWDLNEVIECLVKLLLHTLGHKLKVYGAFLMVIDTTLIAKASRKMLGIQKWKNSESSAYQIGHHWAIGGFISRFGQRFIAWPFLCRLISGQKAPCLFVGSSEGTRQATFWDTALALVYQAASHIGGLPASGGPALRAVVDAYFSKAPFLNPCIEAGIGVISRLRHDSKGWDDPPPYPGRGRPRKWGKEWRLKDLLSFMAPQSITVCIYGKLQEVRYVVRDVRLREVTEKVRVVIIEGIKEPVLLLSTDISLSARAIIEMYASRFSIEIAIRDLKQHFGLGDYQTTTTSAFMRFVHLCCLAFCLWRLLLLTNDNQDWLQGDIPAFKGESPLSFIKARRCLKRFVIKRILFSKSAPGADFEKVSDEYEPIFRVAA